MCDGCMAMLKGLGDLLRVGLELAHNRVECDICAVCGQLILFQLTNLFPADPDSVP